MSLYEQIKADLGYLNLTAAQASFATLAEQARLENWTHIDFLAQLVAEQATADRDRRLAARPRYARFPFRRSIEDFDYDFQPGVDRKLVEDLATLRFIDENRTTASNSPLPTPPKPGPANLANAGPAPSRQRAFR